MLKSDLNLGGLVEGRAVLDEDSTRQSIFMLVQLVALLHSLVKFNFLLRSDDGLAADGTSVVVVSPAQQALNVEDVVFVALQSNHLVGIFELEEANGAL